MNKILTVITSLFLLQSCSKTLSDKEIKTYVWKCGNPCGLSDVVVFNENTDIRNDTIFLNKNPYAKIVKRDYDWDEDTKIKVINLNNFKIKDTCEYHAK